MQKGKRFYNVRQVARKIGKSHQMVRFYIEELDWEIPYLIKDKHGSVTYLFDEAALKRIKRFSEKKKRGRPFLTDEKKKEAPRRRRRIRK